jgi:hypothetical protein
VRPGQRCLFCGGDVEHADHALHCDGKQGHVEARVPIDEPLDKIVAVNRDGWKALTNRERFERFDTANPHVYRRLADLALHLRGRGVKRAGMQLLYERLRWTWLETHGEPYKLNNTYAPFYARQLMDREPLLEGFFETRASPHDPNFYEKLDAALGGTS